MGKYTVVFNMGYTTLVLVSMLLITVPKTSASCSTPPQFLGRVGFKCYFVNNIFNIDWFDAKRTCENMGMVQATIETADELTFLKNATQAGVYDKYYWLAARDSHKLSQFQWVKGNSTGTDINVNLSFFLKLDAPQTCVLIQASSGNLEMAKCSHKSNILGSLCEAM